ncbi:MAG: phage tail tube protein [Xanthomonadaceae bacterium]|nr:phage tail tube protein [Xanthomonadaceae bacterium]
MPAIGGIQQFFIDSVSYPVKGNAHWQSGGMEQTHQMSAQGEMIGYEAKPVPAMIEIDLYDTSQTSIGTINAIDGSTITIVTRSGKTYSLSRATREGQPMRVDLMAGSYAAKFAGTDNTVNVTPLS